MILKSQKKIKMLNKRLLSLFIFLLVCALTSGACKKNEIWETEDNNSFDRANLLNLTKKMKGYLQSPNDVDFFVFTAHKKAVLDINVSAIKGINHSVKIWRSHDSKTAPTLVKLIDDGRKSSPERIRNFTVYPETYYISIQHGDGDAPRENTENPYIISVKTRDFFDEEEEPNDTIEESIRIEPGQSFTGYFSPAYNRLNLSNELREEDWFAVPVECQDGQPVLLNIYLSAVPGINSVLEVYNPDGNLVIKQDANSNDAGESVLGLGIKDSGIWYVVVSSKGRAANHENPYTLTIAKSEYDSSMEIEPNNTLSAANDIINGIISGRLNYQGDIDFFKYTVLSEHEIVRIELQGDERSDFILTIYSEQGTRLFQLNDGGAGTRKVYPNLSLKGSVFFAVSANGTVIPENNYTLKIETLEIFPGMELEPNDTNANPVSNAGKITGFTSIAKDVDNFHLKYNGRVHVDLNITAPKNGEIKVSVTDPMRFALKTITVSNGESKTLSEMIDGTGYIRVEAVKPDFDNPYEIEVKAR